EVERGVLALRARRYEVLLLHVIGPGELDPGREFTRGVLSDVETGATHPVVLTPAARARYRELLAEQLGPLAPPAERTRAAEPLDRRRFRPALLFVLQLVLLLALIAGLVRPYVQSATPAAERVRLLVVLDVSASMQAREEGGTRFELARRRARALVAQLLTGDEVMLVTAAERAHVLLAWTADHARAQDRLEALEPLDTPTDLAAALELALGERR